MANLRIWYLSKEQMSPGFVIKSTLENCKCHHPWQIFSGIKCFYSTKVAWANPTSAVAERAILGHHSVAFCTIKTVMCIRIEIILIFHKKSRGCFTLAWMTSKPFEVQIKLCKIKVFFNYFRDMITLILRHVPSVPEKCRDAFNSLIAETIIIWALMLIHIFPFAAF